jgi:hypothetical protein
MHQSSLQNETIKQRIIKSLSPCIKIGVFHMLLPDEFGNTRSPFESNYEQVGGESGSLNIIPIKSTMQLKQSDKYAIRLVHEIYYDVSFKNSYSVCYHMTMNNENKTVIITHDRPIKQSAVDETQEHQNKFDSLLNWSIDIFRSVNYTVVDEREKRITWVKNWSYDSIKNWLTRNNDSIKPIVLRYVSPDSLIKIELTVDNGKIMYENNVVNDLNLQLLGTYYRNQNQDMIPKQVSYMHANWFLLPIDKKFTCFDIRYEDILEDTKKMLKPYGDTIKQVIDDMGYTIDHFTRFGYQC